MQTTICKSDAFLSYYVDIFRRLDDYLIFEHVSLPTGQGDFHKLNAKGSRIYCGNVHVLCQRGVKTANTWNTKSINIKHHQRYS